MVSGFTDLDTHPRLVGQGQGPTTVEAGDVRQGLQGALADLEAKLGAGPLEWEHIYACSSAAGGLKMTVHGLVYDMTARAAREAALGAGAVLHHVTAGPISDTDLDKIRQTQPKYPPGWRRGLWGGPDHLGQCPQAGQPHLSIPLIYAGNVAIQADIEEIFRGTAYQLRWWKMSTRASTS